MPKVSEAHLERRRQQILDAAIVCFARKGFHQTTMADIAAEARVSATLAYRYFSGKEDLIEAAVRQHGDASIEGLLRSANGIEDFRVLCAMLIDTDIRRFDHPAQMTKTMGIYLRAWAEALHDDAVRIEVVDRWKHHYELIEAPYRRAQQAGQVSPEVHPLAVAWVMLAIHYGLNLLAVIDEDVDLHECRKVALAMLGGLVTERGDP